MLKSLSATWLKGYRAGYNDLEVFSKRYSKGNATSREYANGYAKGCIARLSRLKQNVNGETGKNANGKRQA